MSSSSSAAYATKLNLKDSAKERAKREEKAYRKALRRARKQKPSPTLDPSHPYPASPPRPYRPDSTSPPRQSRSSRPHRSGSSPSSSSYHTSNSGPDAFQETFDAHLRDLEAQDEGPASSLWDWEIGGGYGTGLGWGDEAFGGQTRIPKRWQGRESDNLWDQGDLVTELMGEEEWVESIRSGISRRQAERSGAWQRQEALAREAAATAARLERTRVENDRLERARIKEFEKWRYVRDEEAAVLKETQRAQYDDRWKKMLLESSPDSIGTDAPPLRFKEIPWPMFHLKSGKNLGIGGDDEGWIEESVREFLLGGQVGWKGLTEDERKRKRKDILREGIRRYHPDKFTRFLARVPDKPQERARVKTAVEQISRSLMVLMGEQ
ncbi:hypothetical protein [Phaffia rhodozyma]|uniref:Uncharacterized protein n=1 Tax=Phaffia rhodozyma TaxID=264483 RepID=A0A0F7SS54_PHARH|nr:hypothetical protein [Phaffia rhodozyma]